MSKKNLSLTPFARLFLVLLIAIPLSYIGASYYNGEDGIQNITNLFGGDSEPKTQSATSPDNRADTYDLEVENKKLRQEVESLKRENENLRIRLEE